MYEVDASPDTPAPFVGALCGVAAAPRAERLEAWRAAVVAYRRVMQREGDDWRGHGEAIAAYLAVRPEGGPDEAERR